MNYPVIPPGGIPITTMPFLPIEETVPACTIEGRINISIGTGKQIHFIESNGHLYVSEQLYNELKK